MSGPDSYEHLYEDAVIRLDERRRMIEERDEMIKRLTKELLLLEEGAAPRKGKKM